MVAALSKFPEDIFEIIGHCVASTDDATPELLACLHTSNTLCAIALGHLFRHVTVVYAIIPHGALEINQLTFFIDYPEGKANGPQFFDLLHTSPHVASRVRTLTILPVIPGTPLKEELQRNTANRRESSLQHILPMLTSLESLSFPFRCNHFSWRALYKDSQNCLEYAMRTLPTIVSELDIREIDHFSISLIIKHHNLKRVSFETLTDSLVYLDDMRLPFTTSSRPLQLSHLHIDLRGIPRWVPHIFDLTQLKSLKIRARSTRLEFGSLNIESIGMCARAGKLESIDISMAWYFNGYGDGHFEYPGLLKVIESLRLQRHHQLRSITISALMIGRQNDAYTTAIPFPEMLQTFVSGAQPKASVTLYLNIPNPENLLHWYAYIGLRRFIEHIRTLDRRGICLIVQDILDYGTPTERYVQSVTHG